MDPTEAAGRVRAIYARLAERPIERACTVRTECCQFRLTGRVPYLTRGEALVAAKAVRAAGRKTLPDREDGACPLLHPQSGRCLIYEGRPFGCRTHFCRAAGGPYTRSDVADLIQDLEGIDRSLGGTEATSLPLAIDRALGELPRGRRR
jgi:Fe-S-cluster containining protein